MPYTEDYFWKFRGFNDKTFSMLVNRELWFSSPKFFNDPFDAQRDPEKVLSPILSNSEIEGGYWVSSAVGSAIHQLKQVNMAYSCFCKSFDETLMWSHYADNHQGMAIGFNEGVLERRFPNIPNHKVGCVPVIYESDIIGPIIGILKRLKHLEDYAENLVQRKRQGEFLWGPALGAPGRAAASDKVKIFNQIREHLSHYKAPCWRYEQEIRFEVDLNYALNKEGGNGVALPFNFEDISHVIFGVNCLPENKRLIKNLFSENSYDKVDLWDAVKDDLSMKIELEPYRG